VTAVASRPAAAGSKTYLPGLDGLRGVAALAVAGSHFENLSGISLHLQHSGAAVDFFFVLSGFVIGQAYEDRLAAGLSWRTYMGLRLERLYPAILGGLLIGVIVALAAGEAVVPAIGLQALLLPVFVGPVLHGGELFPLNGPQWSLFLELSANALHAAARRWLTTSGLMAIVGLAAAALVFASFRFGGLDVGWSRATFWGGPPRVIYGFGVGLLIWRWRAGGVRLPRLHYGLIAAVLALCLVRPFPEAGLYDVTDLALVLLVMPALVALATEAPPPLAWEKTTLWLGALSYPLYAVHAPLLRACEAVLDRQSDQVASIGWVFTLPIVVALAVLFERMVDSPARRWLRRPAS
jgi:peptidoglycan/LPS O-acetylase OafA/YrhL